jgi:formate-dependent nitrite reductase membrane component NrfD
MIIAFVIGVFVGAQIGLLIAALIGMARDKNADEGA